MADGPADVDVVRFGRFVAPIGRWSTLRTSTRRVQLNRMIPGLARVNGRLGVIVKDGH
jgi:hypothetical protein